MADAEPTGGIRYCGIGMVGDNDMRAHPRMQHITIDENMTRLRKTIGFLRPVWQAQIEHGLVAILTGMDIMQDEVAVPKFEHLPDGYGLYARDKGTAFVIQQRRQGGASLDGVDAFKNDNDILESALSIDQQTLVRYAFSADFLVFVNGQGDRWWRLTVEYDLSAYAAAMLYCDFPVGVYRWNNDE